MAAVAVCYAVTSYANALFTMAWQNDIDPVFTVDPSHKILALTSPSCPLHKALSSDCIPSSSHAMLHPDIGKGRQIEELIIVILKFGEIEKEINAMLATFWFLLQHPSLTDSFSTPQQSRTTPVDSHTA